MTIRENTFMLRKQNELSQPYISKQMEGKMNIVGHYEMTR